MQLPHCPQCGYCLHALAGRHCPECGKPYDPANPDTYELRVADDGPENLDRIINRIMGPAIVFMILTVVVGSAAYLYTIMQSPK